MTQAHTQLPDDDQLKKLVAAVHDNLPEPDNHRLMVIEQQLTEKIEKDVGKSPSKWIWLLAGVLMAGSATAALWIGESFWFDRGEVVKPKVEIPLSSKSDENAESTKDKEPNTEKAQPDDANIVVKKKKSPMIYRQNY